MAVDGALEYQYNARAAVPEHPQIFERWRSRSQAFRNDTDCCLDIAYGPGERQKLDLFYGDGSYLHLFLHGGYWQALDKSYFSHLAEGLVAKGFDVAVCSYPLCPAVGVGGILDSIRLAVGFLRENSRSLGRQWRSLQVSGHSAGGQLAAMLLSTDWPAQLPEVPTDFIDSVICVSGLYDLDPLRYTTINDRLSLDYTTARKNSPLYAEPVCPAPMLLVVGAEERRAFHEQMARFAEKRRGQGVSVETATLPGSNHFTVIDQLARPDGILLDAAMRLTGR